MIALIALVAATALAQYASSSDAQGRAAPISVTAEASKPEVTVGEVFMLSLTATGPPGATWTFPDEVIGESIELRTLERREESDSLPPGVHRYEATAFALNDVEIPPITVQYRLPDGSKGEVRSEPVKLTTISILPKDPKEQNLVDIRDPVPLRIGRAFYLAATGIILAFLALGWLLLRRRRRGGVPAAPPRLLIAPDAEAREALARLTARGLLDQGEFRAFYIALAEIAKRYLERRLEQPVLEMTSTETVTLLRGHSHASDLASATRELMGAADRIKFARDVGLEQEAERHLQFLRAMIDTLEGRLHPRAAETAKGRVA